jgi:hypothetical protein
MVATGTEMRVHELAQHLFDLVTHFCLVSPRGRRRGGDLKEVEFLTLSLLPAPARRSSGADVAHHPFAGDP